MYYKVNRIKNVYKFVDREAELDRRRTAILEKCRVYCKCGHSIPFRVGIDRLICNFCGEWCYRNKEIEDKYKKEDFERKFRKWEKIAKEKEKDVNRTTRRNVARKKSKKNTK